MLARIYGEGDILVGEALAAGLLRRAAAARGRRARLHAGVRVAGAGPDPGRAAHRARAPSATGELQRIWRRIRRTEDEHQVQLCRELDNGFATPVFHWAEGKPLEDVLAETEMAPGDFVRNCKQLIDLLRQIEDVAEPRTTATLVRRGPRAPCSAASSRTRASSAPPSRMRA